MPPACVRFVSLVNLLARLVALVVVGVDEDVWDELVQESARRVHHTVCGLWRDARRVCDAADPLDLAFVDGHDRFKRPQHGAPKEHLAAALWWCAALLDLGVLRSTNRMTRARVS